MSNELHVRRIGAELEAIAIRPLATAFTHDGYEFRQLRREGDVALFAKRKPGHGFDDFEVVVIQRRPATTIEGRHVPAREVMPPSEAWGTSGWTYRTLTEATARFETLIAE